MERHLPVVGTGRPSGSGFNPAIESEAEKREFFDSEKELTKKLDKTAQWVRESKHVIVFTGAGVSTRYIYTGQWDCRYKSCDKSCD